MRLLHPFMPFITEEIWHQLRPRTATEALVISKWPEVEQQLIRPDQEETFALIKQLTSALRNIRAEANLSPNIELNVTIKPVDSRAEARISKEAWVLTKLQKIDSLSISMDANKSKLSASAMVSGTEVFVALEGLIDLDKERDRITKEIARIEGFKKAIESKLSNEKFMSRAPEDVVQNEKNKANDAEQNLIKLKAQLAELG
jgi:valyl-tRNA synthetase